MEHIETGLVRGTLHPAESGSAGIVLAHGAGSNSNAKIMIGLAGAFAEAGLHALRIDLPFRQLRPSGPPHPSTSVRDREGILAALNLLRVRGITRLFLGGHSYGGRQSSMLAADHPDDLGVERLLLLSYPLHPPAKPEQLRTAHLPSLRIPALFVHGTRDPFGTPDELRAAIALIPAETELILLEGAGHDLKPVMTKPALIVQRMLAGTSAT